MTYPCGGPRVGIGVLLQRDNHILIGKRKGSTGAGTWALPGGKLELGESFEECAARELLEETGITIKESRLAHAISSVLDGDGVHWVTIFMHAKCPEGAVPVNCEPEKCEGWTWAPFNSLPKPLFMPLKHLLESGFQLTSCK